ncbi:MAG: FAD-dependent oxidoreductase [Lachnospiraceae bacterium]|nr:FAD-dependent oxidoreductase [Lachnospiraceae bacterium]
MLKITDIRVPYGSSEEHIYKKAAHILGIKPGAIKEFKILKRSKDARRKSAILDVYTIALSTDDEERLIKAGNGKVSLLEDKEYRYPKHGYKKSGKRPVVIGFGPAGIFVSLILAREGYRPLIFERGKNIEERYLDTESFFKTGVLDPDSNVQFGEGGAGTFSDGKLNSGIKDRSGRRTFVLETFVRHGAQKDILTDSHPHVGTDRLMEMIPSIRKEIEALGGEIYFSSKLTGIEITERADPEDTADKTLRAGEEDKTDKEGREGKEDIESVRRCISGICINDEKYISCDSLFLCLGHSARDTFEMLFDKGLKMEQKPFAVGVRAEHKRNMIDKALRQEKANYKLTYHCADDRGVYSFCMCPGGYVVDASSEEGYLTVNGMSYAARDGENSNSAIVCTIRTEDFSDYGDDPLAGIRFQRELERKAFTEGEGAVPYQRYEDFKEDRVSKGFGKVKPELKGRYKMGNIRRILPGYICDDIIEAMLYFRRKIAGYDDGDTLFAGIEARTSSPVRIKRGEDMQSVNIKGIYPAGEGAGYAGGIMSAASDGMKCAEAYIKEYAPAGAHIGINDEREI